VETIKVFVYKNLHKNKFSIKALEGPYKNLVIAHRNDLVLTNVTPKVSQAGRHRVLAEKCKNVHAGLVGYWSEDASFDIQKPLNAITYNPYKYDNFVYKESQDPFEHSAVVYMSTDVNHTELLTH